MGQSGDHCKSELSSSSSLLVNFPFYPNNSRISVAYKNKFIFLTYISWIGWVWLLLYELGSGSYMWLLILLGLVVIWDIFFFFMVDGRDEIKQVIKAHSKLCSHHPTTLCWPNQGTWPKSWLCDPSTEKEGRIQNNKPVYHVLSLFHLSSPNVTRCCFVIFLFLSSIPTSGPLQFTHCLTKRSLSCSAAINSFAPSSPCCMLLPEFSSCGVFSFLSILLEKLQWPAI